MSRPRPRSTCEMFAGQTPNPASHRSPHSKSLAFFAAAVAVFFAAALVLRSSAFRALFNASLAAWMSSMASSTVLVFVMFLRPRAGAWWSSSSSLVCASTYARLIPRRSRWPQILSSHSFRWLSSHSASFSRKLDVSSWSFPHLSTRSQPGLPLDERSSG